MTRVLVALFFFSIANVSSAFTTDQIVAKISQHLVKVYVALPNGYGMGSGVVIADNQVVTNCHVVANAQSVNVMVNGENVAATALKADWHHDLCILKVEGLKKFDLPIATIASSEALQYEQPVYSIGFANNSPKANATYGVVKGKYALDDSVIIRASNTFRLGDSGGGVFDEAGNLVAIIAVKSPGRNAYYYNMSVEWVKKLMDQTEQNIVTQSHPAFWAETPEKWPYFMRVVQPLKTEDWTALNKIASEWSEKEPNATEAIYYRAVAEYGLNNNAYAELYLNQVVRLNHLHSGALLYLGLIAEKNGHHDQALSMVAMLDGLDKAAASDLKLAIGLEK